MCHLNKPGLIFGFLFGSCVNLKRVRKNSSYTRITRFKRHRSAGCQNPAEKAPQPGGLGTFEDDPESTTDTVDITDIL